MSEVWFYHCACLVVCACACSLTYVDSIYVREKNESGSGKIVHLAYRSLCMYVCECAEPGCVYIS